MRKRRDRDMVKLDREVSEILADLDREDWPEVIKFVLQEAAEAAARRRAVREWLGELDEEHGPPSEEAFARAQATFDDLGVPRRSRINVLLDRLRVPHRSQVGAA